MIALDKVGRQLKALKLEGWLVYDLQAHNPVLATILEHHIQSTRRIFLWIDAAGKATICVAKVDAHQLKGLLGVDIIYYVSWAELNQWLSTTLKALQRIAMEYSPNGELPAMSLVDGGTLDLVRSTVSEVVSSAELFQLCAAGWSQASYDSHTRAMQQVAAIKSQAFGLISKQLKGGRLCTEYDIQSFIMAEFSRRRLVTDEPAIVSVNAHSGDPHYAPDQDNFSPIKPGDWVLIDLWAKEVGPEAIYADITWVGYVGNRVPAKYQAAFDVVKAARDAVVSALRVHHQRQTWARGFELDRVAQEVIRRAGYGQSIVHRTGHSLSPGSTPHGLGANLDDLETHDTRHLIAGLGFTIEPGVYLPEFGVRSEINLYMAEDGPHITSPVQTEPVLIDGAA